MNNLKFTLKKSMNPFTLGMLLGCAVFSIADANSAFAALPWEGPLTTLKNSITGTVAKTICAIVVCVTGIMIALGEGGAAGRVALRLVFGLALAIGFLQVISLFG